MERLLAATIDAAVDGGAVKPSSVERVTIDTTVQPKAIAFPTDSRLYHRGREILVRLAARYGVKLRQSGRAITGWASARCAWPIAMPTRGRCGVRDVRSGG
jgi:IS5 family transposase